MNSIVKTPETDAFFFRTDIEWDDEVEFSRNLEIERDAWKDCAKAFHRYFMHDDIKDLDQALTTMSWIEDG
jgi:hypothetical protein